MLSPPVEGTVVSCSRGDSRGPVPKAPSLSTWISSQRCPPPTRVLVVTGMLALNRPEKIWTSNWPKVSSSCSPGHPATGPQL